MQPLPESADDRLARVEQDVCELRRMIKELVTAQREASATQAASSDLSSDNGCLHGAPRLFASTPSSHPSRNTSTSWRRRVQRIKLRALFIGPATPAGLISLQRPWFLKSLRNGAWGDLRSRSRKADRTRELLLASRVSSLREGYAAALRRRGVQPDLR